MNINKCLTEYKIGGSTYASEIFYPDSHNPECLLSLRSLPEEVITSKPHPVVVDGKIRWGWKRQLECECISYYIKKKKYSAALHRLFYMMTIKGEGCNFLELINDKGLAHELVHIKDSDSEVDPISLQSQSDKFERTVPGSYLWSLSLIPSF